MPRGGSNNDILVDDYDRLSGSTARNGGFTGVRIHEGLTPTRELKEIEMRYGMVIDLQRCVGCGACAFACKAENNTRDRADGQSYNWADFVMKTEGTFPNVTHWVMPVLCNHCSNAACVEVCPVTPAKAMYKTPEGITMHDPDLCIGCGRCMDACPYSSPALEDSSLNGEAYSVLSFNLPDAPTQPRWADKTRRFRAARPPARKWHGAPGRRRRCSTRSPATT